MKKLLLFLFLTASIYCNAQEIYAVKLSQIAHQTPTVDSLENTVGNIVWTRNGSGYYVGTLIGAFPESKTVIPNPIYYISPPNVDNVFIQVGRNNDDEIFVATSDAITGQGIDEWLSGTYIEIRVYP